MWYLLKVDALIAALVFAPAGLIILALFALHKLKTATRFFANLIAISRTISRTDSRDGFFDGSAAIRHIVKPSRAS